MTIMELGALGEVIGPFAVLVALIYLAFQLARTKRTVQPASLYNAIAVMNHNSQNIAAAPRMTTNAIWC